MNCKCGHEIARLDGKWYHVDRQKDGSIELTKECITLETEEAEKFTQEQMEIIGKKVKEKFGENYDTRYWFAEVHCTCKNPEPEEGESD